MREFRSYGSVGGPVGNRRPYPETRIREVGLMQCGLPGVLTFVVKRSREHHFFDEYILEVRIFV